MENISIEKMYELLDDQELATKLRTAKSTQEIQTVLEEYGISLSKEELVNDLNQTVSVLRDKGFMNDDELTESGLDLVSGGAKWGRYSCGLAIMGGGIGLTAIGAVCPPVGLLMLGCGAIGALCSLR